MFRGRIIKTATKLIMILRAKKENESKIEDKKNVAENKNTMFK